MKKPILMLVVWCLLLSFAYAMGPRKHPAMARPRTYRAYRTYSSTARQPAADRPYYGGGHHTTSHGGKYYGATNAHHRDGHYNNWRSSNRYGVHKLY
jgi:hypothetical protein